MTYFRFSFQFFFKFLPKFSDFINSDDSIEKITSKSIRLYLILFKKIYDLIKKGISSGEKMRNSGNYIYMIMLIRSSERIFNPSRFTGNNNL